MAEDYGGSCPVPAERGWFELVRCHSDALRPINKGSAAAAAFVSHCSQAGRQRLWRLLQPGSSSGGASTPAPAASELSGARPSLRRRHAARGPTDRPAAGRGAEPRGSLTPVLPEFQSNIVQLLHREPETCPVISRLCFSEELL